MNPSDLKEARMKAQLTQLEASTLVCVNPRTWRRWEAGKSRIPGAVEIVLDTYIQEKFFIDPSIPALLRKQAC